MTQRTPSIVAVQVLLTITALEFFGPIVREQGEPPFHHEWEARVFALNRRLLQLGVYNLDEFRSWWLVKARA